MYIKQVIIQGFRSYRDQTVVEPFSPKHNVIVGRNGSGKSNFFYASKDRRVLQILAIQFVLSDEFSHLKSDQRQSLLHEGTGPRVLNAFVEIVFDNSDNRLPFDKEDVRLRRMIGAKKDQYLIDMKVVTKQDVMNLLESAGFSKSNPYYIVKQGKINELATAADSYRLKLLREVAGTRVYDERKEESKEILRDTESKREKIEELLKYIDERLKTLEEEKEELKEYQKWDKMRRSLEYTVYDRELQEANQKLDGLSAKRERIHANSSDLHNAHQEISDSLYNVQKRLRDLERRYNGQEAERAQLAAELSDRTQSKTKLELTIKDLLDEVDGERSSRQKAEEDLTGLNQAVHEKQDRLAEIGPRFKELVASEQSLRTNLAIKEQKKRELTTKQGWTERFSTVDERDAWIRRNIKKARIQIQDKEEQIAALESEQNQENVQLNRVDKELADVTQKLSLHRERIDELKKKQNEVKQRRDHLQNDRQEIWREETNLTTTLSSTKEELEQVEMQLRGMTGKGIMQGIDGVNRVLQTFRDRQTNPEVLDGYCGLLIANFQTEKQFRTAVEVTAGNRLFYHMVKHDQHGTKILAEFNKQKLHGEVNFFPLNRLDTRDIEYPSNANAVPMIEKLRFDEQFTPVLKHVFGRTLICRNMEIATQMARQQGMDCITLEGDQVSHKGSLTGGFYDSRRSRLQLQEQRTVLREKLEEYDQVFQKQRQGLNDTENQINSCVSEMQTLETKISKMRDDYDKAQQSQRALREERNRLERAKEPKEAELRGLESTLQVLKSQKDSWEQDLGKELLSQLTESEQNQLDDLAHEIEMLNRQIRDKMQERSNVEHEKNRLENQLQTNLLRKKEELLSKLQEIAIEDRCSLLEASQSELHNVNIRIKEISRNLAEVEKQLEEYYTKKKDLETEVEKLQAQEREHQSQLNDETKEIEKLLSKQTTLSKKKDDLVKKIRELGSLPSDAFERYQNLSLKQLFRNLEECNQELKKYENVNKKALDQFVSFSDQKEKLKKRKEELDRGHESILALIDGLDQRKYDSIQLTFKQVSRYFEEVLARLAPGARAHMMMRTDDQGTATDDGGSLSQTSQTSEASSRASVPLVERLTGVGLTVSFSGSDETREMQQLSGGQKSLVALALIFAIQKCDPAPFYLFDEIDAAMDPQHRKAVADMIHDLSSNAQFITTTFRKELLENADKFYGVRFRNKVSHIDCVSKEEAADFVEDDTTHG